MESLIKIKRSGNLARSRKKHWRRDVSVDEAVIFLNNKKADAEKDAQMASLPNDDLVIIDRTMGGCNLTKRQEGYLKKKSLLAGYGSEDADIKPVVLPTKITPLRKLRRETFQSAQNLSNVAMMKPPLYDLWDAGPDVTVEDDVIVDHFMRSTKKKLPNMPSSVRHIPSILPAVDLPVAGASYNPTASSYKNFLDSLAADEVERIKDEMLIEKKLSIPSWETYITEEERAAEIAVGLFDDPANEALSDEEKDAVDNKEANRLLTKKRKTRKMRRNEAQERKKMVFKLSLKAQSMMENQIYRAKKIDKGIAAELVQRQKIGEIRKRKKVLKRLTGTQQLGRGKFKPVEEPFLLPEELSSSLLQLKTQGSIISERLKSYQKRNMMPVPGEQKNKPKLKKRLRMKEVERRVHKD